jgi:hypothetical protein
MYSVQGFYSDGYPLHLVDSDRSIIRIMDYTKFLELKRKLAEMQCIFKNHHIVVCDWPCPPTQFNKEAMEVLASNSKPITIHGTFN